MYTVRTGQVVILPRPDGKTVDVFTGQGWNKHTIFEVTDSKVRFVSGNPISKEEFAFFKKNT